MKPAVTAMIVICAILLFILLLLLLRIRIVIRFNDNAYVAVKALGIPFYKYPKKEKKKKIRLRSYSHKAIQKKHLKNRKKLTKKTAKERPKSDLDNAPLSEKISFIAEMAKTVIRKLFKYIRIDITEISVAVATGDAAKTAVTYAAARQAVAALLDILGAVTNVYKHKRTHISVEPNFTAESSEIRINISFSIQIWQLLAILISAAARLIKKMIKEKYSERK